MSVEETQFVKPLEVVTRINPADGLRAATHGEGLRLNAPLLQHAVVRRFVNLWRLSADVDDVDPL